MNELTQLRARVKEFEASRSLVAMDQLIRITEQNLELKARIRELEEAMPDVFRLRVIAGACNELRQHTAEDSLLKMADKIDKVMRKEGNERP